MSFIGFWRKNLGFLKLAIQQNIEYRVNFAVDALVQPMMSAGIEVILWLAIFRSVEGDTLAGFSKGHYLSYALWASFVARIASNWMYEFKMIEEIESGSVNTFLVRPISFFEAYLSQFIGYKSLCYVSSLWVPIASVLAFGLPMQLERLPAITVSIFSFIIFCHLLSFCVATLAFSMTRVSGLTVAKNLSLWLLGGELIPLDLLPETLRKVLLALPFCNAVYIPVAYITGRIDTTAWLHGLQSLWIGIFVLGFVANFAWKKGLANYVGTGA
jgi:ABC-2 type transport system permease protein